VGTLLLAAPGESAIREVATLRVSGPAQSELPTMALPGAPAPGRPSRRRKPRSLTSLVVLNIVLVALAAAGVAWVMLS
jgi:hypothetical protein